MTAQRSARRIEIRHKPDSEHLGMPWKSASSILVSAASTVGAGFAFRVAPSAAVTLAHLGKLMLESP